MNPADIFTKLALQEEDSLPEPTQEMLDFYHRRTANHITRVQQNCEALATSGLVDEAELLKDRADVHDASKYSEGEIEPYVWLTWWYKSKDEGKTFEYPPGVKDQVDRATGNHVKNKDNSHHPEALGDPQKMSDTDLAEMVCDWAAMSQEKGTSLQDWFDKCKGDKTELINPKDRDGKRSYHWTPAQVKTIQSYVDFFDPDGTGVEDTIKEQTFDYDVQVAAATSDADRLEPGDIVSYSTKDEAPYYFLYCDGKDFGFGLKTGLRTKTKRWEIVRIVPTPTPGASRIQMRRAE